MHKILPALIAFASLSAFPAAAQPADPVAALREAALADTFAWDFTEALTTEVGPRQGGTEAEARARAWAVARLKSLGFANVRIEPFTMPTWIRGEERAEITAPFPQPLLLTALGNSGSTGPQGLEAEIVYFPTLDALRAVPDGSLAGKIAFVSHAMERTQDGSHYSAFGGARFTGPGIAAAKGAAAIIIRSAGTDRHRHPHTGNTSFPDGVDPIPAAALSTLDAEQLERVIARGKPVRVRLLLTPRFVGDRQSGNVIAEIPGSDPGAGIVLAACHLDSWDLGTGAFDDAAGCGIITAAARHVAKTGKPRRTIRLLMAGAEEVGIWGGKAYAAAHKDEPHALAAESDFGADRVWRVDFKLPDEAKALADAIARALAPLGIARGAQPAGGGADIADLARATGVALVDLQQDGTRYFDLHHTADDTLDKIDPVQLRQNVAAWSVLLALSANFSEKLVSPPLP